MRLAMFRSKGPIRSSSCGAAGDLISFFPDLITRMIKMKKVKTIKYALAATAMSCAGVVFAAPQVSVNFINNTTEVATYQPGSSRNETTTYSNASPKPSSVPPSGSEGFIVRATGSAPITYAMVTYKSGSKSCRFTTSYLMNSTTGGVRTPKWNKSAVASGGARCDISITSVNYSNHDWNVTLIMR